MWYGKALRICDERCVGRAHAELGNGRTIGIDRLEVRGPAGLSSTAAKSDRAPPFAGIPTGVHGSEVRGGERTLAQTRGAKAFGCAQCPQRTSFTMIETNSIS